MTRRRPQMIDTSPHRSRVTASDAAVVEQRRAPKEIVRRRSELVKVGELGQDRRLAVVEYTTRTGEEPPTTPI